MLRPILACLLLGCCAGTFAAAPEKAETPQEGAKAILELLKARDYDTLFRQRYSEWHKVEAEGKDPKAAVKKLAARWEKRHEAMVDLFTKLAAAEFEPGKNERPQKTETDELATATISLNGRDIPYSLYRMKNGRWGFHL